MKLFISSAEPSGDIIAAEVLASLKHQLPEHSLDLRGIGGIHSEKQGLTSLFPMSDITVHGFVEVLPKALQILKRIRQTADAIIEFNPDLVITIDAFDFHIRVARILRKKGFTGKLAHLVAPAVWAWGGGRAKKLMQYYNSLYCLLPFEPSYFQQEGFQVFYAGNPVLHRFANAQPDSSFLKKYRISKDAFVLTLLPGSRESEIKRLLTDFLQSAYLLQAHIPSLHVTIPSFINFQPLIESQSKNFPFPITFIPQEDKVNCLTHTDFAIAASGTIALELSLFDFPFVIAYKVSPLTAFIGRRIAKVNYICLVNILMDKAIVPELIQEKCNAQDIFAAALPLIQNKNKIKAFKEDKTKALSLLQTPESMPNFVAKHVLKEITN